jgi:LytS/YehU family sensor histidine kinase
MDHAAYESGNAGVLIDEINELLSTYEYFFVAVYFAVLGIEHAIFYFREARERETQAIRLSAQLAEARLGALRMQMKPHFLLNSLNAVLVLVRDRDHATATRVLEELGEILRHVLRPERPEEVALEEEIDFLRRYLGIEQVRFPDRLRTAFRIPPETLRAAVPDFILQPLVENAVRHGIAERVESGQITISGRREGDELILTVEDDGPGLVPDQPTAGLGLANTRERLQVLYGSRGRLQLSARSGGGTSATIRLPSREIGRTGRPDA